jgi:peptidyl-prolyl cis-trans isomerase C
MTEHAFQAPSCDLKSPKLDAKPRNVSVNGVTIARADIARETQNHAAPTPIAAWKMAARALVVRELLRQEAAAQKIEAFPAVDEEGRRETPDEAVMRALVDREVRIPQADDATCLRYFEQNSARFCSSPLYAPRHILIGAAPNDLPAREAARQEAEAILVALNADPHAFQALAHAHSACPSKETGGSLGQISAGQTVPEFEMGLSRLTPGAPAALIETRYGVHVVVLDHRIDGRRLPFEVVKARIAQYLDDRVRHRAMQQYVTHLAGQATILGIDLTPEAQIAQ